MAEARVRSWDKLVQAAKTHAANEMANFDEAKEERQKLLDAQKLDYENKHKVAIQKQKEAYTHVSEAAEAAKKSSEEADRLRQEQTSAAQTAASSTALAQSSGNPISTSGVSMVQTTVPKGKAAVSVLKQALDERLFADVENVQKVNKRNFVSSGKLEVDDVAAAKLYMVTTDEKVPKLVQLLKDNLSK